MTIAIIDDHQLLLDSLKNLLLSSKKFKVVKCYTNGNDFLNERLNNPPEIILADLQMPKLNGIDFIEKCKNIFSDNVKIIVLSMLNDTPTIKKSLRIGANGFISKATGFNEMLNGIEQVLAGEKYISKDLKDIMINSMFTQEQVVFHLSPREKQVLNKVCQGNTIKEIAYELKLSQSTIQYYHKCILDKFKLKRTTDLVVFAIQNGFYLPAVES